MKGGKSGPVFSIMLNSICRVKPGEALRENNQSIGFITEWSKRYFLIASTSSGLQKLNGLQILPV